MDKILQGHVFDIFIGLFIITIGFLLTFKKKKRVEIIDTQLVNKRILEYKPEPIINDTEVHLLSRSVIESPTPKDTPNTINVAKVNYMDLLNSDLLKKKAEECIRTYGVGSCGPRGFYGTIDVHLDLENKIAEFLGLEETVLYSYGFSTVSSAIGAYCKRSDYIFCDAEISFPAVQGFAAARSTVIYFKHNDLEDLIRKLDETKQREKENNRRFRKFLVVEGIYLKTGRICPLPDLIRISREYKMRIFLNEAHSFGILGKTGRGVTEHFDVDRAEIDMILGSLETSLSSVGGFCVGRSVVIEHQRLSGLGYCFSASLPPFLSYVPLCALEIFNENPGLFKELQDISAKMHDELIKLEGFITMSDAISPLKVLSLRENGTIEKVDKISDFCANNGVYVLKMDDRIQLHMSVAIRDEEIKKIANTLSAAVKFLQV